MDLLGCLWLLSTISLIYVTFNPEVISVTLCLFFFLSRVFSVLKSKWRSDAAFPSFYRWLYQVTLSGLSLQTCWTKSNRSLFQPQTYSVCRLVTLWAQLDQHRHQSLLSTFPVCVQLSVLVVNEFLTSLRRGHLCQLTYPGVLSASQCRRALMCWLLCLSAALLWTRAW